MNVDFNDHSLRVPSQEEYDVAEYVAEIIISMCNRKRLESGSDYELEDDVKKEHAELSKYSLEFMQSVVDYAYEENESGQRRRTWKSVKHRFQKLPNQNYISRFKKYLENNGTKQQKLEQIDKCIYEKSCEARE